MKVIKEDKAIDIFKQPGWIQNFSVTDEGFPAKLNEDFSTFYTGDYFRLAGKEPVYEIIHCEVDNSTNAEIIEFQAFGHPTGNHWVTTPAYLEKLLNSGELEKLSQAEINEFQNKYSGYAD